MHTTEYCQEEREKDHSQGNWGHQRCPTEKCCHRSRTAFQLQPSFSCCPPCACYGQHVAKV